MGLPSSETETGAAIYYARLGLSDKGWLVVFFPYVLAHQ